MKPEDLPKLNQEQASVSAQLDVLHSIALRMGLYDAADALHKAFENEERREAREAALTSEAVFTLSVVDEIWAMLAVNNAYSHPEHQAMCLALRMVKDCARTRGRKPRHDNAS